MIQTLDSSVLKKRKSFQWVESAVFFPQDINLSKSILTLLHRYHLIAVITSCSLLSGVTDIKCFSFFVIEVPKKDFHQEAITDKRKHMSSGLYSCVCKDRRRCAHKQSSIRSENCIWRASCTSIPYMHPCPNIVA